MKNRLYCTVFALALGLFGCGGPTGPSSLSTTDDFIARLREAGASVQRMGQVSGDPLFSVPGTVLSVNDPRPRVWVHEYATPRQAADEAAGVPPKTVLITFVATPHVYQAGQLVVVYTGISPEMRQLLDRILGAPVYSDPYSYDHLGGP